MRARRKSAAMEAGYLNEKRYMLLTHQTEAGRVSDAPVHAYGECRALDRDSVRRQNRAEMRDKALAEFSSPVVCQRVHLFFAN
jgi:hypothetical protein